jgi:hypothetical protein
VRESYLKPCTLFASVAMMECKWLGSETILRETAGPMTPLLWSLAAGNQVMLEDAVTVWAACEETAPVEAKRRPLVRRSTCLFRGEWSICKTEELADGLSGLRWETSCVLTPP